MIAIKHEYVAHGLHNEKRTEGWTLEDGTEILRGVKDGSGHYVGDIDKLHQQQLRRFEAVEKDGAVKGFIELDPPTKS